MKSKLLYTSIVGLGFACSAWAHHSFSAEFDTNKPVELKGVVTKIEWTNPHTWIYVDVKDENGKVTPWAVEGDPPNILYRNGWRKDAIRPGQTITIDGHRAKDGTNTAHIHMITLPDGSKVWAGRSAGGAPPPESK